MLCCFPARLLLRYLTSSENSARWVLCREPPELCLQPQALLLQRFFAFSSILLLLLLGKGRRPLAQHTRADKTHPAPKCAAAHV